MFKLAIILGALSYLCVAFQPAFNQVIIIYIC